MKWPSGWRCTISNTEQLQGKNWSSLEEFAILRVLIVSTWWSDLTEVTWWVQRSTMAYFNLDCNTVMMIMMVLTKFYIWITKTFNYNENCQNLSVYLSFSSVQFSTRKPSYRWQTRATRLPKLLQFDMPTTLSLTILAYLHAFNCCCFRNPRNPEKFNENSNL